MSDRIRIQQITSASTQSPLLQQLEQQQQQQHQQHQQRQPQPGGLKDHSGQGGPPGSRGLREAGRVTQQQRENLMNVNLWKAYLYELQLQAPIPKRIVCTTEGVIKPSYYGREFHGKLNREQCDKLLRANANEDGRYLVRESARSPGQYTLSLRFNGSTKNYRLHYFDGKHFFNEKKFDTLHDLVADALINLYLELHAGDYIASLENQCAYEESPYMTLHKRHVPMVKLKRSLGQHLINASQVDGQGGPALFGGGGGKGQSPNQSIASSKQTHSHTGMTNSSSTSSSSSSGQPTATKDLMRPLAPRTPNHAIASRQLKCSAKGLEALRISLHDDKLIIPDQSITVTALPPSGTGMSSITTSTSNTSRSAGECNMGNMSNLDVQLFEKAHNFKVHNFIGLPFCDYCGNFMWGIIGQGVKCEDCGFSAHKKCSEKVPNDCCPDLSHIRRVFGVDLTTLVKACNTVRPFVVEFCVKEIENRGLHVEGLYRVSGFADDVESLKLRLESEGEGGIETALRNCDDVHVITGVLKMYFRLLPIPLITFDSYPYFLSAVKKATVYEKTNSMREAIAMLPPAHYQTAKFFFNHLVKVAANSNENLMTPYNLSTVFSPTLMKTPNISLMPFQVNAWQVEAEVLEFVITYYSKLFK